MKEYNEDLEVRDSGDQGSAHVGFDPNMYQVGKTDWRTGSRDVSKAGFASDDELLAGFDDEESDDNETDDYTDDDDSNGDNQTVDTQNQPTNTSELTIPGGETVKNSTGADANLPGETPANDSSPGEETHRDTAQSSGTLDFNAESGLEQHLQRFHTAIKDLESRIAAGDTSIPQTVKDILADPAKLASVEDMVRRQFANSQTPGAPSPLMTCKMILPSGPAMLEVDRNQITFRGRHGSWNFKY